jgi:hypothetical protein
MAKAKKISAEQAMEDLKARKHHVDSDVASSMVKKFKTFRTRLQTAQKTEGAVPKNTPELPVAVTYNKKAIQSLLKQPGCEGIRIYPAINGDNAMTFVLIGVDASGENLSGNVMAKDATSTKTVDEGQMSPPYPAPAL